MEMVVRTMSVNLKCARFESNIKGIDASEFPLIPTADGENTLGLPPATLRKIIDQVVFAAADAKDTSRPSLTGVLARFEGDRLTLAATDGYRLSVRRTMLPAAAAGGRQRHHPGRARWPKSAASAARPTPTSRWRSLWPVAATRCCSG